MINIFYLSCLFLILIYLLCFNISDYRQLNNDILKLKNDILIKENYTNKLRKNINEKKMMYVDDTDNEYINLNNEYIKLKKIKSFMNNNIYNNAKVAYYKIQKLNNIIKYDSNIEICKKLNDGYINNIINKIQTSTKYMKNAIDI